MFLKNIETKVSRNMDTEVAQIFQLTKNSFFARPWRIKIARCWVTRKTFCVSSVTSAVNSSSSPTRWTPSTRGGPSPSARPLPRGAQTTPPTPSQVSTQRQVLRKWHVVFFVCLFSRVAPGTWVSLSAGFHHVPPCLAGQSCDWEIGEFSYSAFIHRPRLQSHLTG